MNDDLRNKYYIKTYGISLEQYNEMLKAQNYSCAICKKHESTFKKRLSVDHNHKTGQVRGLLCYRDNKFIVGRHNNKSATELYEYIIKYEGMYDGLLSQNTSGNTETVPTNPKRSIRTVRKASK